MASVLEPFHTCDFAFTRAGDGEEVSAAEGTLTSELLEESEQFLQHRLAESHLPAHPYPQEVT